MLFPNLDDKYVEVAAVIADSNDSLTLAPEVFAVTKALMPLPIVETAVKIFLVGSILDIAPVRKPDTAPFATDASVTGRPMI